jgi:hypothetical protein
MLFCQTARRHIFILAVSGTSDLTIMKTVLFVEVMKITAFWDGKPVSEEFAASIFRLYIILHGVGKVVFTVPNLRT